MTDIQTSKYHTVNVRLSRECSQPAQFGYSPLPLATTVRGEYTQPV
jgi:hypothetical protein